MASPSAADKLLMKPFATRFLILCGAFIGLGVFATTAAAAAPTGGHPKGPLLYVQQTSGGSIVRVGPGAYRLRLTGVSPRVTTFTDRPRRRAGSQGIEGFVHKWGANGFGADPPNAALVSDHAPASRDVALLTLSHPRYDRATQTLTYRVAPLRGRDPALASFAGRADPLSAGELGSASLFVDDGGGDPDTITVNFQNAELTTTSSQIIIDGGGAFCLERTSALSMAGTIAFDALYVTSGAMTFNVQSGTTFNGSVVIPIESQGFATLAVTNFAGTVTVTWPTDTGLETQTMMSGDPITLSGLAT
jgi:hypothetical protein